MLQFECGHLLKGMINFNLLVPRENRRCFANHYAYPDSDPTEILSPPWAKSLRCHDAPGMPAATLWHVSCDSMATCFRSNLTALVLSMFKTCQQPQRPWRPHCNLQCCHGPLGDLKTTQRWSAVIWFCRSQPGCHSVWQRYNGTKRWETSLHNNFNK